jgi:DNA-binding MarR family transcriptional regulator
MISYESQKNCASLLDFDTKKESYKEVVRTKGLISRRQRQVLLCLEKYGCCCDKEIAEHTGLDINQVTPRRGELAKKGLIKVFKQETSPYSNKLVDFWGLTK